MTALRKPSLILPVAGAALLLAVYVFVWRDFGSYRATAILLIVAAPSVVAARLYGRWPAVRRRKWAFLAVLFCVAVSASIFSVQGWYAAGLDREHAEDVRWSKFGDRLRQDPAFNNLQIFKTRSKRDTYWVRGVVASQAEWNRLLSLAAEFGIERLEDGPYRNSVMVAPPKPPE